MKISKILLFLISFVSLILIISSVNAADLDNETVFETPADDNVLSIEVGAGDFASLENAIGMSRTIELTGDITRTSSDRDINIYDYRNVTINGNGHTINANRLGRIFFVLPGGQLTLNNVKLTNGYLASTLAEDFDGGAILNMGTLTVTDCQFTNNFARNGGAIASDSMDAAVTLSGTNTFSRNSVWQDGGAISNQFGSKLVITGKNTFDSNSAYFTGQTTITVDEGKGGAILNAFASLENPRIKSSLYMSGESIFNNNEANSDGGAIFNHQAVANVTGKNTFTNNKLRYATSKGGAINNENATFYLSGENLFQSNAAYRGGAIDNNLFLSTFTMSGKNIFRENRGSLGGAIANQQSTRLDIYGENIFESNKADYGQNVGGNNIGGAIFSYSGYLNIDANNIFTKNSALGAGGAIYSANNNVAIKGTNTFTQNSAPTGGALIFLDSTRVDILGENVFDSNTASSTAGAIRANNVKELILGNHNYFSNNRASHSGGAIYTQNSVLNTQGALYESNSAQYGGAIFLENTAFAGNYNIFKNNYASATGSDIESYQSSINSLEYNYWNSQNKVAQNNIHNYDVSNIRTWTVIDFTIPSQIKQNTDTEVVRFKTNTFTNLNGEMPMYGVAASPNFNPSTVIIKNNVGTSQYTGPTGQVTVTVSSSNFGGSKAVNVIEGKSKTKLTGNNVILNDSSQSANYEVVLSDASGKALSGKSVSITVDGRKYTKTTNSQGKATLTLNDLENGYHEIVSSYAGETNYYDSTTKNSIVCLFSNQSNTNITGSDFEMYYKDGSRYYVTLTDSNSNPLASKNVKIYINNNAYDRVTNSEGKASIAINLDAGEANILSVFAGDDENEFAYVENTITIKTTIFGNDVVKYYRNATQYYAKFLDSNGNPLKNTAITFNINGVMYTRNTNASGIARMNINLNPGVYVITAMNTNGEMNSNTITVLSFLQGNDLTKYYRNDSQYYIKVLNDDGTPAKANDTVNFNINGVFYKRAINASGYARMNINLDPGVYIITAEYNGLRYSNTVTVLPVLYGNDITMKYRDGTRYRVKLIDGQGNPMAGKLVGFNVNGVFYERTTASDGYASLNINLIPGKYIITSIYDSARTSNQISISM
ncbi:hypothetical protein [Methanobrevibacter sp.]|uniref:hypothetical protein n=1 Tax=Methanobrevibacter sp. TaxID=66852 RepID=UPI00388D68D3